MKPELTIYRMPDQSLADGLHSDWVLALNGTALLRGTERLWTLSVTYDHKPPQPMLDLAGALEQALKVQCQFKDRRSGEVLAVAVHTSGNWFVRIPKGENDAA